MRIFVTGATGFIGSAVVAELIGAGHRVVGLARSDDKAKALAATGAEVHRGSLEDLDSLRAGARAADGVAHLAFVHDFARMAVSGEIDRAAIAAIGEALAGSGRPFVMTSAIGMLPQGRVTTEADGPDTSSPGGHRVASEAIALALAGQGVRVSSMRLPPSVHGPGDYGFVPELIRVARARGVAAYIEDGANRWPAVHRLDAARLYRRALEDSAAGAVLHSIADEGVPTRAIAEAIGRGLGVPVRSIARADAAAHFGWIARFFALDVPASSARTQAQLGWTPREPGLLDDLALGHYFAAPPSA